MFDRIRKFRNNTFKLYVNDHRKEMEPWKKRVMDLHERSDFLFYYENCELEKADGSLLVIQGDLARHPDTIPEPAKMHLFLYDGQARLLGRGILMSDPTEKEEKRRGFLRSRKYQFIMKVTRLYGKDFSGLGQQMRNQYLDRFYHAVSLISDISY